MMEGFNQKYWNETDLPSLTNEDITIAEAHKQRLWALNFVNPENYGQYTFMRDCGVALQNTGPFTVRCIYAVDHYETRISLAMIKHTLACVNVKLEMGEFTVVAPYLGKEDGDSNEESVTKKSPNDGKTEFGFPETI